MKEIQSEIDVISKKAISSIRDVCNNPDLSEQNKIISIQHLTKVAMDFTEGKLIGVNKEFVTSW